MAKMGDYEFSIKMRDAIRSIAKGVFDLYTEQAFMGVIRDAHYNGDAITPLYATTGGSLVDVATVQKQTVNSDGTIFLDINGSPTYYWDWTVGVISAWLPAGNEVIGSYIPVRVKGRAGQYYIDSILSTMPGGQFPTYNIPSLAQILVTGGGTVAYGSGNLTWTNRFIIMGLGRNEFCPGGFFATPVPAAGVAVPVYCKTGVTSVNTVTGGVPMGNWDVLYYELPVGQAATVVNTSNFRIVNYVDPSQIFTPPAHWVMIAARNIDIGSYAVKMASGQII